MRNTCIRLAAALAVGLLASACSTMTPSTYANYADNTVALRKFSGSATAAAISMDDQSHFDAGCRLAGPIQASGNRTVAQFIRDSFNDELKFAGVYADDSKAAPIDLVLLKADFSSQHDLLNGWWEFTLKLTNHRTGFTYTVSNRYDFKSGFDAATACTQTANAMTPAVQKLIYAAVSDSQFATLIKN